MKSDPFGGVAVVSKEYLVTAVAGKREVTVRHRSNNAVILTHRTGAPEYVTIFVDLAGDKLVIADEDDETSGSHRKDAAQSFIYDLRTKQRTRLADIYGALPPSEFGRQATVTDDGRYFYSAKPKNDPDALPSCIAMVDLNTMKGSTVECARDGEIDGLYVAAGEDGATWLHIAGPTVESCRTGRGIKGSQIVAVGPKDGCATLGTATVNGWSVWSATAMPGTLAPNVALLASDGGKQVELGDINGVALTMCGDYAYWRIEDKASQSMQIRRWSPGMAEVELAYQVPTPSDSPVARTIGLGNCADDLMTIESYEVGAADTSTVQILTVESLRP